MYRQFSYVNYNCKLPYKYTTQLGVIIKREYPGLLEEREEDGRLIRERPALDWPDYFLGSVDRDGRTKGEHVLHEFWVRGMFFVGSFSCVTTMLDFIMLSKIFT